MSYGPPPVFTPLKVADVHAETHELVHLALSGASTEFMSAYSTPGQYVQIKVGTNKPGFFALASAPGEAPLELLIKRGSPISDAIVAINIGEPLEVSAPAGKGYPLAQSRGKDLFLVGVGSGMAPLRAVVHYVLKNRGDFKRVVFVYGARTCAFPYQNEFENWRRGDVELTCVCSQPHAGSWSGPVGRVQHIIEKDHSNIGADSNVFCCGMKAMVEDVKSAFTKLGLAADRIHQNF
jgi:NAD(P)H-flavin reductase